MILDEFQESFETVYELFEMNMTLKIHVIIHYYADFFNMTKTNMKNTNGEHHEALHHSLKDFERTKGFFYEKKKPRQYNSHAEEPQVCFNI
jgi:hypothetical protein